MVNTKWGYVFLKSKDPEHIEKYVEIPVTFQEVRQLYKYELLREVLSS